MATVGEDLLLSLDLDLLDENFTLDAGELFRTHPLKRNAKKPLNGYTLKIFDEDGEHVGYYKTNRIKYAMKHRISDFGELILDDDGIDVAVSHSIKSLFAQGHRASSRVFDTDKYDDKKRRCNYMVRIVDREGIRQEKVCLTMEEALKVSNSMFSAIWDDELKRLNLLGSYYDGAI